MDENADRRRFVFPRWANYVVPWLVLVVIPGGLVYKGVLVGTGLNPTTLNVGYQPKQPVAYNHELHVSKLGLDCRYCHTTVEKAAFAAIPPAQTCMNCHYAVKKGSRPGSEQEIAKLVAAYETGQPLTWKKVHDLPDYAFFNHSIHINAGVSCVECQGRVDHMDGDRNRVSIVKPLSMGWCLSCHRAPQNVLRPADQVTNLAWGQDLTAAEREKIGHELVAGKQIRNAKLMTDCSACHR